MNRTACTKVGTFIYLMLQSQFRCGLVWQILGTTFFIPHVLYYFLLFLGVAWHSGICNCFFFIPSSPKACKTSTETSSNSHVWFWQCHIRRKCRRQVARRKKTVPRLSASKGTSVIVRRKSVILAGRLCRCLAKVWQHHHRFQVCGAFLLVHRSLLLHLPDGSFETSSTTLPSILSCTQEGFNVPGVCRKYYSGDSVLDVVSCVCLLQLHPLYKTCCYNTSIPPQKGNKVCTFALLSKDFYKEHWDSLVGCQIISL